MAKQDARHEFFGQSPESKPASRKKNATPKTASKPVKSTSVSSTPKKAQPARVRAHAVLRLPRSDFSATGVSCRELFIPPLATQEQLNAAEAILIRYGFKVVSRGSSSLTIEGSMKTYQKVFHSSPEAVQSTRIKKAGLKPDGYFVLPKYRWAAPPQIPTDLSQVVDAILLPDAAALH